MAKIDKVKETISLLKFWLGIAVATLLTLSGWLALNYAKEDLFVAVGAGVCVVVCGVAIYCISRGIMYKIQEIEEL